MIKANCGNIRGFVQARGGVTRAEIEEVERQAKEFADDAKASAEAAESARDAAEQSAASAEQSKSDAAFYADAAQQVAEKNGYMFFSIENGHLYETRTDNVEEDINFVVEEGRLIAIYE